MGRIYLRLNGSDSGCVAKLPGSFAELLEIANAKLLSSGGKASRIFAESSDEILEDDFDLIESNDVLYVSTGEAWVAPPAKEVAAAVEQQQPVPAPAAGGAASAAAPMEVEGASGTAAAATAAPGPASAAADAEAAAKQQQAEEEEEDDDDEAGPLPVCTTDDELDFEAMGAPTVSQPVQSLPHS